MQTKTKILFIVLNKKKVKVINIIKNKIITAQDVFTLLEQPKYKAKNLELHASFFEIYSGKVICLCVIYLNIILNTIFYYLKW